MQQVIHFIHYIQFTSFTYYIALALGHILNLQYTSLGSRPCTTSAIYIASLGFENEDVKHGHLFLPRPNRLANRWLICSL
jgi:hypothetical protein